MLFCQTRPVRNFSKNWSKRKMIKLPEKFTFGSFRMILHKRGDNEIRKLKFYCVFLISNMIVPVWFLRLLEFQPRNYEQDWMKEKTTEVVLFTVDVKSLVQVGKLKC